MIFITLPLIEASKTFLALMRRKASSVSGEFADSDLSVGGHHTVGCLLPTNEMICPLKKYNVILF